jgi:hypothetical protein
MLLAGMLYARAAALRPSRPEVTAATAADMRASRLLSVVTTRPDIVAVAMLLPCTQQTTVGMLTDDLLLCCTICQTFEARRKLDPDGDGCYHHEDVLSKRITCRLCS